MSTAFEPLPRDLPIVGIADDNDRRGDRRWQPPPADPRGAAEDGDADLPRRDGCLIIGPSGAGKTSLLLALQRACGLPEHGDPDLRFVARPEAADLVRQAVRIMTEHNAPHIATRAATDYDFEIHVQQEGKTEVFPMTMSDGPGGAFFPNELRHPYTREDRNRWEEHLLERARMARALVLCVDATNPASDRWEERLPKLLSQASGNGRIRAQRILILLTKVDTLCHRARRAVDRMPGSDPAPVAARESILRGMSDESMAKSIDPIQQLRALLGVYVLNELRTAAPEGGRLAVGLCSAGGFFRPQGERYWLDNGKPATAMVESRANVLRAWTPWGIREALYYLVRGEARHPVCLLDREAMLNDATPNVDLLHAGAVQYGIGVSA